MRRIRYWVLEELEEEMVITERGWAISGYEGETFLYWRTPDKPDDELYNKETSDR